MLHGLVAPLSAVAPANAEYYGAFLGIAVTIAGDGAGWLTVRRWLPMIRSSQYTHRILAFIAGM
ncbi:hypothetical protein F0Q45_16525 [Mycobacterium simiae]|uniref:Uncharacterized protein n=1 Tax=Mycobacterium simiae TaxID=1784 RepID=A0A5B1BKK2_MYCSI|nr:hypothetical protein [Mycobacterium simiae]KAA1249198.1 hypothetical protein F0Q45_16525 [Mycobacterium simiae]